MIELIQSNWLAFVLIGILASLIAAWLVLRGRKPVERTHRPDVLDEGVAPAQRNQALIDAPPASGTVTASTPVVEPDETTVATAVLANEPGVDAERAAEVDAPGAAAPVDDDPVFEPNTQDTTEGSAVAAAAKIHSEEESAEADDLSRIKGVGPKLLAMLGSMGISRYDQIAAWTDEDVQRIDADMGRFAGRITRDDWRGQAQYLARGDTDGYEGKFGKL